MSVDKIRSDLSGGITSRIRKASSSLLIATIVTVWWKLVRSCNVCWTRMNWGMLCSWSLPINRICRYASAIMSRSLSSLLYWLDDRMLWMPQKLPISLVSTALDSVHGYVFSSLRASFRLYHTLNNHGSTFNQHALHPEMVSTRDWNGWAIRSRKQATTNSTATSSHLAVRSNNSAGRRCRFLSSRTCQKLCSNFIPIHHIDCQSEVLPPQWSRSPPSSFQVASTHLVLENKKWVCVWFYAPVGSGFGLCVWIYLSHIWW